MRNKNISKFAILVFAGGLFTASCSNESSDADLKGQDLETVSSETNMDSLVDVKSENSERFQVPTPNELFEAIQEANIKYDASILNSVDNLSKYESSMHQALNFGIYTADLAFVANNEIGATSLSYFKTIRQLSANLNIENAFNDILFERIEENSTKENSDSLLKLSNDTYFDAYAYLEDNDRNKTLAYIVLGGWVESLYILTELGQFEEGNVLSEKVADQKYTLENVAGLFGQFEDDEEIQDMVDELMALTELFDGLEVEEDSDVETTQNDDGTFMFSGGSKVVVTEDSFVKIKELVGNLRNQITNANI